MTGSGCLRLRVGHWPWTSQNALNWKCVSRDLGCLLETDVFTKRWRRLSTLQSSPSSLILGNQSKRDGYLLFSNQKTGCIWSIRLCLLGSVAKECPGHRIFSPIRRAGHLSNMSRLRNGLHDLHIVQLTFWVKPFGQLSGVRSPKSNPFFSLGNHVAYNPQGNCEYQWKPDDMGMDNEERLYDSMSQSAVFMHVKYFIIQIVLRTISFQIIFQHFPFYIALSSVCCEAGTKVRICWPRDNSGKTWSELIGGWELCQRQSCSSIKKREAWFLIRSKREWSSHGSIILSPWSVSSLAALRLCADTNCTPEVAFIWRSKNDASISRWLTSLVSVLHN